MAKLSFWPLALGAALVAIALTFVVAALLLMDANGEREHEAAVIRTIAVGVTMLAAAGVLAIYAVFQAQRPLSELAARLERAGFRRSPPESVYDDADFVAGVFGSLKSELELRVHQRQEDVERLATVLEAMAEGVIAVDRDLNVLVANDSARAFLGFVTAEARGRPLIEVTRVRAVHDAVRRGFREKSQAPMEFSMPGAPERRLAVRTSRLPGDPSPGVVVVLYDLTELRRLESLRRDLVANVSHELKTPLAAIKAYAETLKLGAISDPAHNLDFVGRIEEQADRLHRLIMDILRMARFDAGKEPLELTKIEVSEAMHRACQQFQALAIARDVKLEVGAPASELLVRADRNALETVLNNLIDNAVKFTSAGGTVLVGASSSDGLVRIAVKDTGVGIPERELENIFERFYRVDRARQRDTGGAGLGLSIVKQLVEAMGGYVHVESLLGRGSTFGVYLPRVDP